MHLVLTPVDSRQRSTVYIETILYGGSPAQANAEATAVYTRNYNAGEHPAIGSLCEASDIAFRQSIVGEWNSSQLRGSPSSYLGPPRAQFTFCSVLVFLVKYSTIAEI